MRKCANAVTAGLGANTRYHPMADLTPKLIQLLADGQFHSGEALGGSHDVSRAAIWKQVKHLEALGLDIQSVPGKGYRLQQPPELLDSDRIRDEISPAARPLVAALEVHDQIDSTNAHLMRREKDGLPSGTLCMAEWQSGGHGRRGRAWQSPFGHNIYLSVLWRFDLGLSELAGLSLAAGVAIVQALESFGLEGLQLKWPNDIYHDGGKLGGVLVEVVGEASGPCAVVLGVGLNRLLTADASAAIDQPWTDLVHIAGGLEISRNQLAGRIADRLLLALQLFVEQGLPAFADDWNRHDALVGQPISIHTANGEETGIARGVDAQGALLVRCDRGLCRYLAGEVSLRPD